MTPASSVAEVDCPEETILSAVPARDAGGVLHPPELDVECRPVTTIPPEIWNRLASANPWATPFSAWAFQRAWWDAYGSNAHDETLLVSEPSAGGGDRRPIGIVPLMRRHVREASDGLRQGHLRHGHEAPLTALPDAAMALFMGASYHADYATILADPDDLPAVCRAVADHVGGPDALRWDAIDLRRLRCGDPAADELAVAFGGLEMAHGWTLNVEREDVCPVATIPEGADFDGFLATLGRKERHEIRRKIRRAEAAGDVRLDESVDPIADLDAFVELHQARWGDDGLFPPTPAGAQSRTFVRRLFELFGPDGPARLTFLSVGGRRIAAGLHFETPDAFLYYNAGMDPAASQLSPGVLLVAWYVKLAIARGRRRMDFLRGDEPYKYEWGAVDEPVRRLLVRRTRGEDGGR